MIQQQELPAGAQHPVHLFARLGSRVTVVEALDRLVSFDEPEASRVIAAVFADEGITRDRLARIGIHVTQARTAALFQLATELPAAILARVLGIDIKGAARWQRACGGDWTTYAANVSRRR